MGKSSIGRHETPQFDTGIEAALSSKQYEFGDTINLGCQRDAFERDCPRRSRRSAQFGIQGFIRSSTGLHFVVRDGRDARLLAFDDSLRRRSFYSGEKSRARARAFDQNAVSGRLTKNRSFSRRRGRIAARKIGDNAGRTVSHEHGGRFEIGAKNFSRAGQGNETNRDGHGRQTDRRFY